MIVTAAGEAEYLRLCRDLWECEQELATEQSTQPDRDEFDTVLLNALTERRNNLVETIEIYESIHDAGRIGNWIPMYSGCRFWPEDPRASEVFITDIAHSLARINRFNGHTKESYSVAQHSVLVARALPRSLRLFGLLHDAGECYLGDIISPLKRLVREFYEPAEEAVMNAIAQRYRLDINDGFKKRVKRADLQLLATEFRDLTTTQVFNRKINGSLTPPLNERIGKCWSAVDAEVEFHQMFDELCVAK